MENKVYNRQELEDMTIFEVRERARKIGVASPTSKNKTSLIDCYLNIASGDETPKSSNRGRPPKSKKSPLNDIENNSEDELITNNILSINTNNLQTTNPEINYNNNRNNNYNTTKNINTDSTEDRAKSTEMMLESGECERKYGLLDIHPDGYGFLRAENCEYSNKDTYVSSKIIRGCGLRCGDMVKAIARKNSENKPPAIIEIELVNGRKPENLRQRPIFDNLIPIYPNERLHLEGEHTKADFALRSIDLIAPIGKGQRAMIVSPPKAGKTTLLKKIAGSITRNHPEVELFVLLVDERPEEVTDMKRSIKGEVIYSTFDEAPEHHCKAAELLIERAKRNVELGKDVVIIMDSLTRLARAYNLTIPPTGRTLSGGMDPGALHSPKRFFGSARNIENGGSLTIVATALVDTGSRMDDVIYEEFKGTGNMEIHLDRKLSERRIFPAIDLNRSSTRREDLLLNNQEMEGVMAMRKMLSSGEVGDSTEQLINMMIRTKNNKEFLENINTQMKVMAKEGYQFRRF